jgi:formate hydrogenlyase subunit 3/multisubunit Na+/H+ antiporter MnhD subunit
MASVRPLSAALWAAGAAHLYGDASRSPDAPRPIRAVPAAAAMIGAFSLAGLPLLGGFPGRWLTLSLARGVDPIAVAGILFGTAAAWFAVGRWGWSLSRHPMDAAKTIGRARRAIMVIGSAAVVLLGVLPGWLFGWGVAALGVLTTR